jgi:hypothetical protein
MKPYQCFGYSILQTTAISAIVGTRVNHGLRPTGSTLPSINYYEVNSRRTWGFESVDYSINCRAKTAGASRDLARLVLNLFTGSSSTGIYGTINSFDISRASLKNDAGLIPETEDDIFNSPVDITIVYPSSTVN